MSVANFEPDPVDEPAWLLDEQADLEGSGDPALRLHRDDGGDYAEPITAEAPESFTDAHVAEKLADHLRGLWLYVATSGRWLRWTGVRWEVDQTEQVYEVARQWVIELASSLLRTGASGRDLTAAASYRNRHRLEAALTMARRVVGIAAEASEFDANPDLLNVANGVLDLRTGTLSEHDPRLRLSKLAPVVYRPDAHHPDVDELLRVVDPEVLPFLRSFVGYSATGHTSEDVVGVAAGGGANGKSTLLEAIGAVLGDYAGPASPQLVMRTSHEPHPTIKADLQGKRLVWISETEDGGAFRMEQVKALTGGDKISARVMRGDYFTFTPSHTLVIATNHRPSVNSTEHAAWRRLRLIPFPYTYKPKGLATGADRLQDPRLRHRLVAGQVQREALLVWIVQGAIDWHHNGIADSSVVTSATDEWRNQEDVIMRFATECLDFGPGTETRGRELYNAYTDWCGNEGRKPKSNKNFATEFLAHEIAQNVTKIDRQRAAFYEGVTVRATTSF